MTECSGCHQPKPRSEFQRDRTKAGGRRKRCRTCVNSVNAVYRRAHRREIIAIGKAWAAKNRTRTRAATKRYRQRHPARNAGIQASYRRKAKTKRASYNRRWCREHPDLVAAANHRKRARLLGAAGSFTAKEFRELCVFYGNVCLRCQLPKPLTPDHVVPLVAGGSNFISNIQPLCLPCNSSKGVRATDYRKAA
jgi:5-methylcytosine-specific restriction endonuclease McrA